MARDALEHVGWSRVGVPTDPESSLDAIAKACVEVGVLGSRFREDVSAQVRAALVARRGRDALRLTGETGTGKELVSKLVHRISAVELGRRGELVEIDCSNLPDGLFESLLFGHKRGAFTGAAEDRIGLLERARGGTLVLDEVQNLNTEAHGRLLRLLGEREFRPVGSTELKHTDALFVLASNRDLVALANEGRFRRDLLDRAPAKIALLPLWQRREDVPELAQAFAREAAADRGWTGFLGLARRAIANLEGALVDAREGSVRRLRELIRDAICGFSGEAPELLESEALEPHLRSAYGATPVRHDPRNREDLEDRFDLAIDAEALREITRRHGLPEATLCGLVRVLREIDDSIRSDSRGLPPSYRNLMDRTSLATKASLWLLSGAKNQGDFRRFFGKNASEMPPKSVAWKLYHDLFGEDDVAPGHGMNAG